jgi:hypothetical protein
MGAGTLKLISKRQRAVDRTDSRAIVARGQEFLAHRTAHNFSVSTSGLLVIHTPSSVDDARISRKRNSDITPPERVLILSPTDKAPLKKGERMDKKDDFPRLRRSSMGSLHLIP